MSVIYLFGVFQNHENNEDENSAAYNNQKRIVYRTRQHSIKDIQTNKRNNKDDNSVPYKDQKRIVYHTRQHSTKGTLNASLSLKFKAVPSNTMKLILWFNHPFWFKKYSKAMDFSKCRVKTCALTTNTRRAKHSDAILFEQFLPNYAPEKMPGQKWVFATFESPLLTGKRYTQKQWTQKFDWLMSYHRDADIFAPFGITSKKDVLNTRNYSEIFKKKSKLAVIVHSNCQPMSRRGEYLNEMMKYMNIDHYGRCGNMACIGDRTVPEARVECHKSISHKYKFYLAFESSICDDYTTEKYFNQIRDDNDLVPVVRGAPNVGEYLPPGTYIDTNDFSSPKELAEYLIRVGSDETLYTKYLKEKHRYRTLSEMEIYHGALCSICERLSYDIPSLGPRDIMESLKDQCHEPKDLQFNRT